MEGKNIVLTKRGESIENVAGTQQERVTVKGVVTDSKGEPIIGANVLEKGTTNGIITLSLIHISTRASTMRTGSFSAISSSIL